MKNTTYGLMTKTVYTADIPQTSNKTVHNLILCQLPFTNIQLMEVDLFQYN